ncbi:glycine cleavage system T protein [Rhizodiscina lignyota]|uniref:Aminomethyltransferase n=1 Tax=Rhizodiscina lignyota TaxID=1504668 RepID=A0A9P4I480_9PEZI|nr:glycine cleavage system T protein [Rhizodiscina lignyota]
MVPFGGFYMPVQYSDLGIGDSHKWTREKASLFDVSHMLQHSLSGPGAAALLKQITPSSIDSLEENHSTLSCLLHPTGGIVDDTVITRLGQAEFYFVTNAGCRDKDCEFLASEISHFTKEHPELPVHWETLDDRGLVALQGPLAADILTAVLANPEKDDLSKLYFGQCKNIAIRLASGSTVDVMASRGGYTGEDGFELSIPNSDATVDVTETLLQSAGEDKLRLAGLGARDSLRLEAGMCLYGHDIDDSTTPAEAALGWVVAKDRRTDGGFHGADKIVAQLKPKSKGGAGVERRRVGFTVEVAPAREGAEILDAEGNVVGKVTSGCPSPSTGKNVAMGYVKDGLHKAGTELWAVVRGKKRKAIVTKMPFVETKYYKS